MQKKLFDIEPIVITETCKTCVHRERHQCNSKVFQYCGLVKSNRTYNGKLKIKCKTKACIHYEKEKQNTKTNS